MPITVWGQDNFNGVSGTTLQAHEPQIGGAWQRLSFNGFGAAVGGSVQAVLGAKGAAGTVEAVRSNEVGAAPVYRLTEPPPSPDYSVRITGRASGAQSARMYGVLGRLSPTETLQDEVSYYAWLYSPSETLYVLLRSVYGEQEVLDTWAEATTAERTLELRMTGSLIEGLVGGVVRASHVDDSDDSGSLKDAGRAGLIIPRSGADTYVSAFVAERDASLFSPGTISVGEVTYESIAINGTPASGGEFFFYAWGRRVGAGDWETMLGATSVSTVDTDVVTGEPHWYRRFDSTDGASGFTNVVGPIVPLVSPDPPLAPTLASATATDPLTIALAFTLPGEVDVTYRLERRIGAGAWVVAVAGLTGTVYIDERRTPGVMYTYRIAALKGNLTPVYSVERTATTPMQPPPPAVVTSPSPGNVSGSVSLAAILDRRREWVAGSGYPSRNGDAPVMWIGPVHPLDASLREWSPLDLWTDTRGLATRGAYPHINPTASMETMAVLDFGGPADDDEVDCCAADGGCGG